MKLDMLECTIIYMHVSDMINDNFDYKLTFL